ncbi:zinc ribbon domain-containing protein [Companilactobacillus sp.]|uniref:zinc ribbon domain-containing protein n=1 Tax=Companilactobacillus sp. TaxID=2767905 RepID=UPI00260D9E5A|nr:zinc ribbon domain-containing protein [Companilactobacillus sp.]
MKCPNCGADIVAGQKFCNKCGFNLESVENPTSGSPKAPIQNNAPSSNSNNNAPKINQNVQPHPVNNGQQPNRSMNSQNVNGNMQNPNLNNGQRPMNPNQNGNMNQQPNNGQRPVQPQMQQNMNPNMNQNMNQPNNGQFQQPMNNQNKSQGNFNNQSQGFNQQNPNQNYNQQQKPSSFSNMIPFLEANIATGIIALAVIILLGLFSNFKIAGVVLVIALVGWYFLADKFKNQPTEFNKSVSNVFKNSGNSNSTQANPATDDTMKKIRLVFIIGAAVTLLFLFVGSFLSVNPMVNDDLTNAFSNDSFSSISSSYSFNDAINQINSVISIVSSGLSLVDQASADDLNTASTILSIYKWIMIIAPIVTLIFSFVKNNASKVIRIISSVISAIGLLLLPIGLKAAAQDGNEMFGLLNYVHFGFGYYLALLGALAATVGSIIAVVKSGSKATNANYFQFGNMNNVPNQMNMQNNPNNQPQNGPFTDLPTQNNKPQAPNNQVNPENQPKQPTDDPE